jgi:uncharacterized membrane protein required for colicin V production
VSSRETDTATAIAGIAAIAIIIVVCVCSGIDETIVKVGVAAIAGLAGFSIRGLIRWQ